MVTRESAYSDNLMVILPAGSETGNNPGEKVGSCL